MGPSLGLPTSPRTAVFRSMETIVRNDPTMARVLKPKSFRTWHGHADDAMEFTIAVAPAMRWTPANTAEEFATPDSMRGWLLVNCEILVRGSCSDDMLNFWYALERAFYPSALANRNANIQTLQKAGARSGLVLFSQPAFDPSPDHVFFAGAGQLKIEISVPLNT